MKEIYGYVIAPSRGGYTESRFFDFEKDEASKEITIYRTTELAQKYYDKIPYGEAINYGIYRVRLTNKFEEKV